MNKIKNKLLLAFILVSLIPLVVLGGYGLTSITTSLKTMSTSKLSDKVTLVSAEIEAFLKNVTTDLFYLRDSMSLHNMLGIMQSTFATEESITRKTLEQDFLAFSMNKKIYHQIRFLDASGMEIVRIDRVRGMSSVIAKSRLQDKKSRYYFTDTAKLKNGELMISPLDLNRERGEVEQPIRPVIRYGTPVYDSENQLQGIVLFNVMAEKLLQLVRNNNVGNEQLLFIDPLGNYFSHPESNKEWGGKADLDTGINFSKDYSHVADQVIATQLINTIAQDQHIIATAPVFLDQEKSTLLGNVVDIVPTADVFRSVVTFRNIFLLISAIVFLATTVLAIALAKSITDPIVSLTRITQDMSKGKLSKPVVVNAKDETKILAESIELLRKSMIILFKRARKKG